MGIDSIVATATVAFYAAAGKTAVFTPATGAPVSCKIFINKNVQLQPTGMESLVWERGTTIEALYSEITREPNVDEKFTYDSIDYTVKSVLQNDGVVMRMAVV